MTEGDLINEIERLLLSAGWHSQDIIRESTFVSKGRTIRPDLVLCRGGYPLTIMEVGHTGISPGAKVDQLLLYAEAIGVETGYIITDLTDTGFKISKVDLKTQQVTIPENLPNPLEILESTGLRDTTTDPRLYPFYSRDTGPPHLNHIIAVRRALDSILQGNKRVLISTPIGSGISWIGFQIAWKLLQSERCRRLLFLSDRIELLHQAKATYEPLDPNAKVFSGHEANPSSPSAASENSVHLGSLSYLLRPVETPRIFDVPPDFYDLIIYYGYSSSSTQQSRVMEYFSNATLVVLSSVVDRVRTEGSPLQSYFGPPIYEYSLEDAIATEELKPPQGFTAIQLCEIADIDVGISRNNVSIGDEDSSKATLHLINARTIRADGSVNINEASKIIVVKPKNGSSTETASQFRLIPNDILITALGSELRVALWPAEIAQPAVFSSSLIRVRVRRNAPWNSEDVCDFLRSDSGRTAIRRITRGTSQSHLSIIGLSQLTVFLRDSQIPREQPEELSALSRVLHRIKEDILPRLEGAEETRRAMLVEERVVEEEEVTDTQRTDPDLTEVSVTLRELANTLVPPTLEEVVLSNYPTPIALPYRRFLDSRFSIHEKVLRLKDLFESISFFVYHMILADALNRLDADRYFVTDKNARKAYNHYSMAARMDFVRHVLRSAEPNNGEDLFVPELMNSNAIEIASHLQDALRNPLSHTATASESRLKKLLQEFEPEVIEMLEELRFISEYRMVRITAFYFSGGKFFRRMEVYSGSIPGIDEQELPADAALTRADRDHLILLDQDEQVLDLYPFYQLLANEDTRYENHLCFLKQRKRLAGILEGESIEGALSTNLEGFESFDLLLSRFSEED